MNLFKITPKDFDLEYFLYNKGYQNTENTIEITYIDCVYTMMSNHEINFYLIISYQNKYYRMIFRVNHNNTIICKGDLTEVYQLEVPTFIYTYQNYNDD